MYFYIYIYKRDRRDLVRLLCAYVRVYDGIYLPIFIYIPYTPPDSNYYTDVCVPKASSR